MTRPIVEFQNVSKTYRVGLLRHRAIHALRDVSFQVRSGCVFGLLGPKPRGQDDAGQGPVVDLPPTSGTILRLGRPVADTRHAGRRRLYARKPGVSAILDRPGGARIYGGLSLLMRRGLAKRIPPVS